MTMQLAVTIIRPWAMECVMTANTTPQVFTVNSASISFTETWVNHLMTLQFVYVSTPFEQIINKLLFLEPKIRALMGSESITHEAKGWRSYWLRGHEDERNNYFSKIQLVGQKNIEAKHLASLLKLDFNPFLPTTHYKYGQIWWVLFATRELCHLALW